MRMFVKWQISVSISKKTVKEKISSCVVRTNQPPQKNKRVTNMRVRAN